VIVFVAVVLTTGDVLKSYRTETAVAGHRCTTTTPAATTPVVVHVVLKHCRFLLFKEP